MKVFTDGQGIMVKYYIRDDKEWPRVDLLSLLRKDKEATRLFHCESCGREVKEWLLSVLSRLNKCPFCHANALKEAKCKE